MVSHHKMVLPQNDDTRCRPNIITPVTQHYYKKVFKFAFLPKYVKETKM